MDENRRGILNDSNKIISKLHLLSNFFEDEIIYKIYLRSQVIHQLFESNTDLDINKLELFHLQFTAAVIDLLKKIKKTNEKTVSLLYNEITLNEDLISQLNDSVYSEKNYHLDKQRQALKVNTSLRKLYQVLSEDSSEYPFSKNINSFSSRYSQDFFLDISSDVLLKLIEFQPNEVYSNAYALIERKLMGILCKYDFKTEFFCGLKAGDSIAELYKFMEADRYYLFYPARNLFLFCEPASLEGIDLANTAISKKERIIRELKNKNDELESRAGILKSALPNQIRDLLSDHYKKISDIGFLQNISNFDVQANILKTMLNTDMM